MTSVDQDLLSAEFTTRFGVAPRGIWSAPGRVNLIGEHVDYNDGLCLPIALPQRTWAAMAPRSDGHVRLASAQMDEVYDLPLDQIVPGTPRGWGAYAAGVLGLLAQDGHPVTGADVLVSSDVPVGAGLSSSAALGAAVGAAASEVFGLGLLADDAGRARLAEVCRRAENEIAGAPTGGMDQAAALRSQAGHALLLDCRDGSIEQIPFAPDSAGLALLVVDTRAKHALVDGQYGERRASCEQAAELLGVPALRDVPFAEADEALAKLTDPLLRRRAEHVIREIQRVRDAVAVLRAGDYATLGLLFVASHASLRYLFEVSCPELDLVVDTAIANGALGARMTGGGFGGSAIVLVPADRAESIAAELHSAFLARGWRVPQTFQATAGHPAE